MMEYSILALIGALAAILANKGIAVFNDGLRPIIPQYYEGSINRKELATMSFAISFGLVIGFGIPTSIAATILLIHCILLTTDIIGSWCPDTPKGTIIAGCIGAIYGVLIIVGLDVVVTLFGYLPYDFIDALGSVSKYITVAFAVFPAIAVAYQHGVKKGAITATMVVISFFIIKKFGVIAIGSTSITLNAEGMSMLIGTVMMLVFAATMKVQGGSANADLVQVFSQKVFKIRKHWLILAIMGGLIACATSMSLVAGDPISLALTSKGAFSEAMLAAFARALGFIPLVFTTAIVTGVYAPAGCTFVFAIGLMFINNPVLAFFAGALIMIVELALIQVFAKGMDTFPGVKEMGEHIRTSMNKVLEVALLVGAVTAAEAMSVAVNMSGIGALFIIGCLLLNRVSKRAIVELAIGPVACILYGILINIMLVLQIVTLTPA